MIALYQSHAASQFILSGNVNDRFLLPLGAGHTALGTLTDFLVKVLLPRFDVVLSYDLGNGLRVEKGGELFTQWPTFQQSPELPREPRAAVETLTRYFRYNATTCTRSSSTTPALPISPFRCPPPANSTPRSTCSLRLIPSPSPSLPPASSPLPTPSAAPRSARLKTSSSSRSTATSPSISPISSA